MAAQLKMFAPGQDEKADGWNGDPLSYLVPGWPGCCYS